jgi:YkoY family integral membrane protein
MVGLADWSVILMTVGMLVVLEGLLSADNALVLAVMVRHLPKGQQKRALRYGMGGAFFFRLVAVLGAGYLLEWWAFKLVGGGYLVYLAARGLLADEAGEGDRSGRARSFWGTVLGVELADIAFSIDSILAAVALAEGMPAALRDVPLGPCSVKTWTVYVGGVLGIVAMRFVAGYFLRLLERFPPWPARPTIWSPGSARNCSARASTPP